MPVFPELLEKFPIEESLPSGKKMEVRILQADDKDQLWEFFQAIPDQDKLYLKEDMSQPTVAEAWCKNLDYETMLPIASIIDKKLVGYALIQHDSHSWQRHVGMVRVAVHPQFRNLGIASALLLQIVELGINCGLEKLQADLMADQKHAIHMFEHLGFVKMAVIPKHLIDTKGKAHDYVMMIYNMRDVERNAAD